MDPLGVHSGQPGFTQAPIERALCPSQVFRQLATGALEGPKRVGQFGGIYGTLLVSVQ